MKRSALVIGATGGAGREVVRSLVLEGYEVFFTGRRQPAIEALVDEIPQAHGFALDATDRAAASQRIAEIDDSFPLHAYVHLAGGYLGGEAIEEASEASWSGVFSANWETLRVTGSLAYARMKRRGAGSIVTFGALAALSGGALSSGYAVAKAAVVAFTRCLAEEGRVSGVRANCIVPGILDTPGNRAAMPHADRSAWVPVEELARAVAFLCSDRSAGVNGSLIQMKGGL
ncbi:MAG: SDR family NAD(P)-dependent oxidoreductase [Candidatus Eisenbacteria bacterium]|nr:SDR family oxidoreductase [Candidatus Eisenbacteria bacterium]